MIPAVGFGYKIHKYPCAEFKHDGANTMSNMQVSSFMATTEDD